MVDDRYVEHHRAGEYLRVLVDGEGRSPGTARTYAGRLALYLTWAAGAGVEETSPTVEQLAGFSARWLERTPTAQAPPRRQPAARPGRERVDFRAGPFASDCRERDLDHGR